jgi:hypothetical protein
LIGVLQYSFAVTAPIFTKLWPAQQPSVVKSYSELNKNPTNGLVADTTLQADGTDVVFTYGILFYFLSNA